MEIPYHNRMDSTCIDGMHTVKDVVCNIMDVVLQKKNYRCPQLELFKADLEEADRRFLSLSIPRWLDLTSQSTIISKPKGMKTHDWKQLVHQRILQFSLCGLFRAQEAEEVLITLLDCISDLCAERVVLSEEACRHTRLVKAVKSFETYFPKLMNVTTHLLVHLSEQMKEFGPAHSTWLYAYERFNNWLTSKIKRRSMPEVAVMETYRVHEWCSRQVLDSELGAPDNVPEIKVTGELQSVTLSHLEACQLEAIYPSDGSLPTLRDSVVCIATKLSVTNNEGKLWSTKPDNCLEGNGKTILKYGDSFVLLQKLLTVNGLYYAFCQQLVNLRSESPQQRLFPMVVESSDTLIIPVDKFLAKPAVYQKCKDKQGVYIIVNYTPSHG